MNTWLDLIFLLLIASLSVIYFRKTKFLECDDAPQSFNRWHACGVMVIVLFSAHTLFGYYDAKQKLAAAKDKLSQAQNQQLSSDAYFLKQAELKERLIANRRLLDDASRTLKEASQKMDAVTTTVTQQLWTRIQDKTLTDVERTKALNALRTTMKKYPKSLERMLGEEDYRALEERIALDDAQTKSQSD